MLPSKKILKAGRIGAARRTNGLQEIYSRVKTTEIRSEIVGKPKGYQQGSDKDKGGERLLSSYKWNLSQWHCQWFKAWTIAIVALAGAPAPSSGEGETAICHHQMF